MPSMATFAKLLGTSSDIVGIALNITEWYKAQEAVALLNDGEYYRGLMKETIEGILEDLTNYAESITHVETGTLAGAHMWEYDSHKMQGRIFIDPTRAKYEGPAVIWNVGIMTVSRVQYAAQYGFFEHERGGEHAFYERTYKERAPEVMFAGLRGIVFELPR